MARRGLALLLVWVLFLADLLVGAAFLLSPRSELFMAGLIMVLAASLGMAGVTLFYYVQQRRQRAGK